MTKNKTLTKNWKKHLYTTGKIALAITGYVVATKIVDGVGDSIYAGLADIKNSNVDAVINYPIITQAGKTLTEIAGSSALYFIPKKLMNAKESTYEKVAKYGLEGLAVLNAVVESAAFVSTTLECISHPAYTGFKTFMNKVGKYPLWGSLALPWLNEEFFSKKGKK